MEADLGGRGGSDEEQLPQHTDETHTTLNCGGDEEGDDVDVANKS